MQQTFCVTAILRRLKRKLSKKDKNKSDEPFASRDVNSASRDDVTSPRALVKATDAAQVHETTSASPDVNSASRDDVTSPRALVKATDAAQVHEATKVSYNGKLVLLTC